MLREALHYLTLGMSVIPLKPNSKEPLLNWKPYQSRKASEAEIREWFRKFPSANLGIVTGAISSVVVVDLDGPEGLKSAKSLGLTSNLISLTGNGKQLWYANLKDSTSVQNSVKIVSGIDLRGEGGYVVAPPSIHPNGKRYRFNRPVLSAEKLSPFPTHIFATPVVGTQEPSVVKEYKPKLDIAALLEEMKDGNIDITLFRICSRLRNDGYSKADARALLYLPAKAAGATEGHLDDKIENVWGRYEPKRGFHRFPINRSTSGGLVLHTPSNQDSLIEYDKRTNSSDSMETIATGYVQFDILTKGLKAGECLAVCARTGVGKTNWILTPMRTFCQNGKKVLCFSTEMSFDQIWQRYRATLQDSEEFKSHQLFICDEFTPDIERIEEAIKNVRPDLFIFDHISHIGTDYHIISRFMSEIKRLARMYNIPAIVTAQLNRNADYVEQGQRIEPRLSMIQGSDQIGQMSAQVLLLNEKRIIDGETEIEGIVVKNRHGDRGMIQFMLKKGPYRMVEL